MNKVEAGINGSFSNDEIETARAKEEDIWTVFNRVLYQLCKDYPGHSDLSQVVTKIMIIGKTYSVPIERRRIRPNETKLAIEPYYRAVAKKIIDLDLDAKLREMRRTEPSQLENLGEALCMHLRVMNAIKEVSNNEQRSFASKYLHFHAPKWFFIFDSIACRALYNCGLPQPEIPALADIGDKDYRNFVTRAEVLRKALEEEDPPLLTPRELDRLLYRRGSNGLTS